MPVAHALLGASVVAASQPQSAWSRAHIQMLIGGLLANAADLDFLLVYALGSRSWHRGFTHSLGFSSLILVVCALWLGRRQLRTAVTYAIAFGSHAVLDFVTTTEGRGVELFWPFSQERVMLGWWGLSESPSKLTSLQIAEALGLEFALFTPVLVAILIFRRRSAAHTESEIRT